MTVDWQAARAMTLMAALGAGDVVHPGGTLLAHLERVHHLTIDWRTSPRVQLAALCHAAYGTDGFPRALLPTTDRDRLRDAIGSDAELLVYQYCACDRAALPVSWRLPPCVVRDRFTRAAIELVEREVVDFAVLTIANELDVVRHGSLPTDAIKEIGALIRGLAAQAPGAATRALADPAFA
jgi:hypothetical protein